MMSLKRTPITLVLFDAFDTLVTPRIAPHLQYVSSKREKKRGKFEKKKRGD